MKKKRLLFVLIFSNIFFLVAQKNGNLSGGYESYLQYYQDDEPTNFLAPSDKLRSMHYFTTQYSLNTFSFGVKYEAFLPQAFLGYNPALKGNGIATYFARYKNNNLDITVGNFYEQFGSGLAFRAWEDRQLGIDNAIKGLRLKYNFDEIVDVTVLTGNQRLGFEVSKSTLYATNVDIDINKLLKSENINLKTGFSYIGRYQELSGGNPNMEYLVGNYSSRINLSKNNFYADLEYVYKESDARVVNQILLDQVLFDGDAWLLNLGYSQHGLGINTTLRRLENIQMYSERLLEGNPYNNGVMNFIPGLTKQHDFSLANIYVYQAQPSISFGEEKVGEIGGQIDLFYTFKRKSLIGGKYGTKFAFNFSRWHGLKADFNLPKQIYTTNFLQPGELYYQDINLEIRKKVSKKLKTVFSYINLKYNKPKLEGEGEFVNAQIIVGDFEVKLPDKRSTRLELQHLNTDDDLKSWAAILFEFNFNYNFSIYASDMYNYGNEVEKLHYFNTGISYNKSSTRLSINYGRQRGGLLCVGGICRYVPANKGVTLSMSLSF